MNLLAYCRLLRVFMEQFPFLRVDDGDDHLLFGCTGLIAVQAAFSLVFHAHPAGVLVRHSTGII